MVYRLKRTELGVTVVISLVIAIIYWYASDVGGRQQWLSVATAIVGTFVGAYVIFQVRRNTLEGELTESDETREGKSIDEAIE